MVGGWRKKRQEERAEAHRSVYGLLFGICVYLGMLVVLAVAPNQLLQMHRDGSGTVPSILHRYNDLGRGIREPFTGDTWMFSVLFLVPIVLGCVFHLVIRDEHFRTVAYYLGTALLGLLLIGGSLHLMMHL